jgi:D-citramalate synthase
LAEKTICAGKTSGKANIEKPSGIRLKLNQEDLKLVQRIIELEIKKKTVTKEDLPYIISDVLQSNI